jgi:hypothetical protein
VNVVGFGPTFYFRPFFDVPDIPLYLYLHGAVGTAWFVLVVAQTLLIARRNIIAHRRLGWTGAILALIVLVYGVYTSTNMVPRNVAAGNTSAAEIALFSAVTAADLAGFIVFPTLVVLGVWFRRSADLHKRLMLLASWSILGPAVARIASWFGSIPNPVGLMILLCFAVALIVHDIRTRGRPHRVTLLATLFFVIVNAGMQLSGIGSTLVQARLAAGGT